MASDRDKYTREYLDSVIKRLRDNPAEFERISSSLNPKFRRTLQRDLDGAWEKRVSSRIIDPDYMQSVCNTFLNRFASNVYNSIINIIVDDVESQKQLDAMVGKYTAYWPSGAVGNFVSWPFALKKEDGIYSATSTTGDADYQYNHFGYAFLIRHRVHVVDVRKNGIRSMILHYEQFPARNPVKGIISNVLRSENNAHDGEQLYAAHFIAFHEKDARSKKVSNDTIADLLFHPNNRTGVIRV